MKVMTGGIPLSACCFGTYQDMRVLDKWHETLLLLLLLLAWC